MLKTRLSGVGIPVPVTIGAIAGLVALVIGGDNGRNDTVLHANPRRIPASWLAYRNGERGLRLRYPPSWHVAPTNLTPHLGLPGMPWEIVSLATFAELDPTDHNCAHVLVNALATVGVDDAFISVDERRPPSHDS